MLDFKEIYSLFDQSIALYEVGANRLDEIVEQLGDHVLHRKPLPPEILRMMENSAPLQSDIRTQMGNL